MRYLLARLSRVLRRRPATPYELGFRYGVSHVRMLATGVPASTVAPQLSGDAHAEFWQGYTDGVHFNNHTECNQH